MQADKHLEAVRHSPPRVAARPRRTQAQRRDETRRQLLEATTACLVELGYHGTTTLAVEQRAGVSRGARVHHFPTKAALLAGVANHLFDQFAASYAEAFAPVEGARTERARVRRALHMMWAIQCRPENIAHLELTMAARTDDELRARLQEVATHHRVLAASAVLQFFPSLGEELSNRLVETIHSTMIGTIMRRNVEPSDDDDDPILAHLETMIVAYFPADKAADGET